MRSNEEPAGLVLIVEDNRNISEMVGEYLEGRGFEVDYASDGLDGYRLAAENSYDVIVLDLMNALENVAMPMGYANVTRDERLRRAHEALAAVGLGNREGHRPSEMSGGQQQRVAIARALINRPLILLADEPTGALDSKTGEEILALFKRLQHEGLTVVLITHDPDVAHHCDRTFVMYRAWMKPDGSRGTAIYNDEKKSGAK